MKIIFYFSLSIGHKAFLFLFISSSGVFNFSCFLIAKSCEIVSGSVSPSGENIGFRVLGFEIDSIHEGESVNWDLVGEWSDGEDEESKDPGS